jgi:hypothetical protein
LAAEACGREARLDGVEASSRTVRRSRSRVGAGRLKAFGVFGLAALALAAVALGGAAFGAGAVALFAFGAGAVALFAFGAAIRRGGFAAALAAVDWARAARRLRTTIEVAFALPLGAAARAAFRAAGLARFLAAFRAAGFAARRRPADFPPVRFAAAERRDDAFSTLFFAAFFAAFFAMARPRDSLTVEPK